jgi:hypothetical protein
MSVNLASGYPCPECGRDLADLLGIGLNRLGHAVTLQLHCHSCETVFVEKLEVEATEDSVHMDPTRRVT